MQFQWDESKEASNLAKHGVAFEEAAKVFADPYVLEVPDTSMEYGELRINAIGLVGIRLLHVTYTERGDIIRIISARRANGSEALHYEGNRGDA